MDHSKVQILPAGKKYVVVLSDHQPLRYLLQASIVNAKVHRWRVLVAEFDIEIKYIAGHKNFLSLMSMLIAKFS